MPKYLSAFIHIYIAYGMSPAQLLHVVVKQAGKLYFRITWSQSKKGYKDQESIQPSTIPDLGCQWKSDKLTGRYQKREPKGQPFPSR